VTLPVEPAALERLERSAATGADRRAVDLARAHNLRTLLIYGGAFAGAVLLALGGRFALGRSSANAAVAQTERRLAAAFEDGPDAAAAWVGLMEANDLRAALANCRGSSVYGRSGGAQGVRYAVVCRTTAARGVSASQTGVGLQSGCLFDPVGAFHPIAHHALCVVPWGAGVCGWLAGR